MGGWDINSETNRTRADNIFQQTCESRGSEYKIG